MLAVHGVRHSPHDDDDGKPMTDKFFFSVEKYVVHRLVPMISCALSIARKV